MWVRGLKLFWQNGQKQAVWSHPVWVRGLKLFNFKLCSYICVAPRVGAWIETDTLSNLGTLELVAPRVGAWIETSEVLFLFYEFCVAPRVGAWIETLRYIAESTLPRSRTPCGCVD